MKILFVIFLLKFINCKNVLINDNDDEIIFKISNNDKERKGEHYSIEKISNRKSKLPKINSYNICKYNFFC